MVIVLINAPLVDDGLDFFISSIEETPPEITNGIFTLLDNLMVSLILDSNAAYNECGDVNNDGILNVVDIVAIVSIILGS